MAKLQVSNVKFVENPCCFDSPFQFEVTLECIAELHGELKWKMTYVGSSASEYFDQVLETIVVGPVLAGSHIFVFKPDPPDANQIPDLDIVGTTIVQLTCSYRGQQFVHIGYFINSYYTDQEMDENPPPQPLFDTFKRNILSTKLRMKLFDINWDDASTSSGLPNENGVAHVMGMEDDNTAQ